MSTDHTKLMLGLLDVIEMAVAVLARAGRKVTIVPRGGQKTEVLPFKRPQPRTMEAE